MVLFNREVKVDSRYALKEELEEVKEDVKRIKEDTLELKTIGNFIKWIVVVSIPLIPIITSIVEEVKNTAIGDPIDSHLEYHQKSNEAKLFDIGGDQYMLLPNGELRKLTH